MNPANQSSGINQLSQLFELGEHRLDLETRAVGHMDDVTVETLLFRSGEGEAVRAWLVRPQGSDPVPAILYLHAHGGRYDIGAREILDGRPALIAPLGSVFARLGFASLMIEMPAFGSRAEPGESARAKARLWAGKSLAGQMLGEQAAAFDWLARRGDIIAGRIGVFGISMGATFSYWLAAVEPRIACAAHLCSYADFATLIESGAHDLHGIYLTIPGLLDVASNGQIAGMIAPRPQLIAIGDSDPLTPPGSVDIALVQTRQAYQEAGAADRLHVHREVETGHVETPAMREAVTAFLQRYLG